MARQRTVQARQYALPTRYEREEPMLSFLSWIILGALVGWIASMIMGTNERQGCIMDIVVGIVGSFIGGLLYNLITGQGISFSFQFTWNLGSILVALIGAVILLAIVKAMQKRSG
jgi:uncharacterized membrane protein YeaQ/YmgE (transglycosylase-associated protein family)